MDHDGGRLPRICRQLDLDPRRVEQSARSTAPVARHLRYGNRGAGTDRMERDRVPKSPHFQLYFFNLLLQKIAFFVSLTCDADNPEHLDSDSRQVIGAVVTVIETRVANLNAEIRLFTKKTN